MLFLVAACCTTTVAAASRQSPSAGDFSLPVGRGSAADHSASGAPFEQLSAAALFPDLGALWDPSAAGVLAPARTTYQFDGGTMEYMSADVILAANDAQPPHSSGFAPPTARRDAAGWQEEGPGRELGSGLRLRESLGKVLEVLFCTMAYASLKQRFDSSDDTLRAMAALRNMRRMRSKITYKALRGRAWDLAPSGAIGVVLIFGGHGSRSDAGQHQVVVATAWLDGKDVRCACSEEEQCLGADGCSLRHLMVGALEKVGLTMGVDMVTLFDVLNAAVKVQRLHAGKGVLYGDRVCVVRNGKTSWPFSAVRQSRGGAWVCLSCRTGDMTCDHASIAVATNKAHADGLGEDSSDSDMEEDDNDEARLLAVADAASDGRDLEAAGAVELPPHLPGSSVPLAAVNRYKWKSRSAECRHLVPPRIAQRERAILMSARRNQDHKVHYPAGPRCPFCLVGRSPTVDIVIKKAKVEFEDGVVPATVETWRCHKCLFRVLPDGAARGVIFHSCYTAYAEAFLFEVAVNLARNGTSLHSSSYLREAFTELHTGYKYPPSDKRMRSVTTLRKALLLYLASVIKGLPYDTVSCATCRRADGSYTVVSFDGLQLGYRVKYKKAFCRTSINIHAVPRASRVSCLITDDSVAKALGRVLSAKREGKAVTSGKKPITTVTAMRGHVMAVTLLLGNIAVGGEEKSFAGSRPHLDGTNKERGWDPIVDGGASVELVALLRGVFDVRRAARTLALTILDASYDLRRRVPPALMYRINELATDSTAAPAIGRNALVEPPGGDGDGEGEVADDAGLREADAQRGQKRVRRTPVGSKKASSSSSCETASDGDVFASDDDGFDLPPPVKKSAKVEWDKGAPLLSYGEALDEPALGTTGGVTGEERRLVMSLPLLPHVPGTAASMLKILEFVRAVTVDPAFVWAPQGSWAAVDAVLGVLRASEFSVASLAAVLSLPVVKEQRLLRGALACFGPGLEADHEMRNLLAAVL